MLTATLLPAVGLLIGIQPEIGKKERDWHVQSFRDGYYLECSDADAAAFQLLYLLNRQTDGTAQCRLAHT